MTTTITIHPTVKAELENRLENAQPFIDAYNVMIQKAYNEFKSVEIASKIAMNFICSDAVIDKIKSYS